MKSVYNSKYICTGLTLCGTKFGWAGRRRRFYGVGIHRDLVARCYCTMDNIVNLFERVCKLNFNKVMIAEKEPSMSDEISSQLAWAARRPKSNARDMPLDELAGKADRFELALTQSEFDNLEDYKDTVYEDDASVMINQMVSNQRGVSSTKGTMT